MIEIKFKAWDKNNKKMYLPDNIEVSIAPDNFITVCDINTGMVVIQPEFVELLQYTGLKNKNGKEIYQGDIVDKKYYNLTVSDGIGVVEMGQGADSDGYNNGEWYGWKAGGSSLFDVCKECAVVGNIYQNPELLKTEETQ